MKVDFTAANGKVDPYIKIIDLTCGFNHCVALTDTKQIHVWGKRMGIYPSCELTLSGIEKVHHQLISEYH